MSVRRKTQLQCPACKKVQVCEVFEPRGDTKARGRRWYFKDHPDIHWFRRHRRCEGCSHEFESAEVPYLLVVELRSLREHVLKQQKLIRQLEAQNAAANKVRDESSAVVKELAVVPASIRLLEIRHNNANQNPTA